MGGNGSKNSFLNNIFQIFCMYFPINAKNWQIWSPMKNQLKSLSFRFLTIIGQNGWVSRSDYVKNEYYTKNITFDRSKKRPCITCKLEKHGACQLMECSLALLHGRAHGSAHNTSRLHIWHNGRMNLCIFEIKRWSRKTASCSADRTVLNFIIKTANYKVYPGRKKIIWNKNKISPTNMNSPDLC